MLKEKIRSLLLVIGLVTGICIFHLVSGVVGFSTLELGILPRSVGHWTNIFTAPLAHGGTAHLIANAIALLTFGILTAIRSTWLFVLGSFAIISIGGGLVWLFGRPSWHIGASGWVYGLWALTISIAWFDRKLINIVVSTVVALFYGGMTYGVVPMDSSVSFEMHLAGVIVGVFCAFVYGKYTSIDRRRKSEMSSM